jgi:predicted esterase
MPRALAVGGQDTVVPPESAVRLARILKTLQRPVLPLWREAGGHSTTYEDSLAAYEFVVHRALRPKPTVTQPRSGN